MNYNDISTSEYERLKDSLKKIQNDMSELRTKYEETKKAISFYNMFHDPDVIISEVNNKNLGHKWVGRVRIPSEFMSRIDSTDKRYYMTFNICDGSLFNDKNDPELQKLAKEKAIENIVKKKDMYFEHSLNKKKIIKLTESEMISLIKEIISPF